MLDEKIRQCRVSEMARGVTSWWYARWGHWWSVIFHVIWICSLRIYSTWTVAGHNALVWREMPDFWPDEWSFCIAAVQVANILDLWSWPNEICKSMNLVVQISFWMSWATFKTVRQYRKADVCLAALFYMSVRNFIWLCKLRMRTILKMITVTEVYWQHFFCRIKLII